MLSARALVHRRRRSGLTLTEMVVVVAIVVLLMAVVLPAMSAAWNERNAADAETKVAGALASVRMKGLNDTERGLFFMLDGDVQKAYEIVAEPYDPDVDTGLDRESTPDRFKVIPGKPLTLPKPFRVVPRSVVDVVGDPLREWSAAELSRQDYTAPINTGPQRHRNFFTMVFSPDGQLRVSRTVLIHDLDVEPAPTGDTLGDRTGLVVEDVASWHDGIVSQPFTGNPLPAIVCDVGTEGVDFPSVDGLLVYDDAAFSDLLSDTDRRDFLLKTAQPLYVSRLSGQVIRGPTGENR